MQNYDAIAYGESDEMMCMHFKSHIALLDANGQLVLNNLRLTAESYCEGAGGYDPRKLLWMFFKGGGGRVVHTNIIQAPVEHMPALARLSITAKRFRGKEVTTKEWHEIAAQVPFVRFSVGDFSWSVIGFADWRMARDTALNFVKMCAGAKFNEQTCEWKFYRK